MFISRQLLFRAQNLHQLRLSKTRRGGYPVTIYIGSVLAIRLLVSLGKRLRALAFLLLKQNKTRRGGALGFTIRSRPPQAFNSRGLRIRGLPCRRLRKNWMPPRERGQTYICIEWATRRWVSLGLRLHAPVFLLSSQKRIRRSGILSFITSLMSLLRPINRGRYIPALAI